MPSDERIYAVIDTNVLVSALYSKDNNSNPAIVIEQVLVNNIIPLFNDVIIKEYKEVLSRSKFNFPEELINELLGSFISNGQLISSKKVLNEIFPDPKDTVFYEVRMAVDDSFLVTGNIKHFPKKPFVITPAEMVSLLKAKNLI